MEAKPKFVPWPESLRHIADSLEPYQEQFFSETRFDSGDVRREATSSPFPAFRATVQLSEAEWTTLQSMAAQPRGTHFSFDDPATGKEKFVTFLDWPNLSKDKLSEYRSASIKGEGNQTWRALWSSIFNVLHTATALRDFRCVRSSERLRSVILQVSRFWPGAARLHRWMRAAVPAEAPVVLGYSPLQARIALRKPDRPCGIPRCGCRPRSDCRG